MCRRLSLLLHSMFYSIGIVIAFFLCLLLLSKKNKTLADKTLVCWLIAIGVHLFLFTMRQQWMDRNYAFMLGVEIPFPLLQGPFLYLYTAAMTNQLPASKKLALLHFITPLLSALMIIDFYLLNGEQKIEVYKKEGAGYEIPMMVNLVAIYISGVFYVCWCSLLLKRHSRNITREFSNTDKVNLNWLRYLVYGIGFVWLVVLLRQDDEWIFGAVVLFILLLGFFGIRQVGIFTQKNQSVILNNPAEDTVENIALENEAPVSYQPIMEKPTVDPVVVKKKYSKSGLTEEQSIQIRRELNYLMEKERVFTDAEITLTELASRLSIHPNYLSQVINEKEETNFYDYINTLRIEEFKRLSALPENKKYTLLSLAFDCGFNSKSSFNRHFKKITGHSPSEYMKTTGK